MITGDNISLYTHTDDNNILIPSQMMMMTPVFHILKMSMKHTRIW